MKIILPILGILSGPLCYGQLAVKQDREPVVYHADTAAIEDVVYLRGGQSAKAYHRSADCRVLDYCSHRLVAVIKVEAEKNRKPCKWCY
jgi:hypothetical protein